MTGFDSAPGSAGGAGSARYVDDAHRYRLDDRIASGGMGQVWRATDTALGRTAAVKTLRSEYADDPTFRARFETEARHSAALQHPGIAAVYDYGVAMPPPDSATPQPYLVMEYVDGQPLSTLLHSGQPMPPGVVVELMGQVAEALGVAHRAGIVHRDIKPANLLVTPDRRVKITDFGIARAADGLALTETGQVMGTPQYLSPEQAEGMPAGPASDVYSLACVAFECLTGRKAFDADSAVATALAHLRNPVPTLPPNVPRGLAEVVRRALAKDPDDRYGDGAALARALRDPGLLTRPASPATAPLPTPQGAPDGATQVLPSLGRTPNAPTHAGTTRAGTTRAASGSAGAASQPVARPAAAPPAANRDATSNAWLWGIVAALIVALIGFGAWYFLAGPGANPSEEQPTTPTTSSRPTPSEEVSPTPTPDQGVEIDEADYLGRDIDDVASELGNLDLRVTRVKIENPGDQQPGAVASVTPSGALEAGDRVSVSYYGEVPTQPTPSTPPPSAAPTPEPTLEPSVSTDPAATAPGNSGSAPGQTGAPGNSGAAPGQTGWAPRREAPRREAARRAGSTTTLQPTEGAS